MCTSKLSLGVGGSVGKGVGKGSHDKYVGKSEIWDCLESEVR